MNSTAREAEDQPPEHENRPRRPEGPSWRWQNCAGALCTTHGRRRDAEASCLLRRATSRRVHEARFVIGLHNLLCTNNAQLPASPPVPPPSRSHRSSHLATAPSIPFMHAVSSTTDATPAPTPTPNTPAPCLAMSHDATAGACVVTTTPPARPPPMHRARRRTRSHLSPHHHCSPRSLLYHGRRPCTIRFVIRVPGPPCHLACPHARGGGARGAAG